MLSLRNSAIKARAAQGCGSTEIAKELGVDVRTVQRVLESAREMPSGLDARPMEIVEALARGYLSSIADYEVMAFMYADKNAPVTLGAKKAADAARKDFAELLKDIGKLPSNMELFASEMELMELARSMGEKLLAVRDGEITLEDGIDFYRNVLEVRQQRRLHEVVQ